MVPTNPDLMKKLLFILVLVPLLLTSCKKDPEPTPQEIRTYCSIISLLKESFSITWVVDGVTVPDEQAYGGRIIASLVIDADIEEISFTAKNADTGSQIESLLLTMEKDKDYLIILYGSAEDPVIAFQQVESARPEAAHVKFQFLHAATTLDSVDLYMGGTEPANRVVTDKSFGEFSGYFEVSDYDARALVTVVVHGDVYDPEKEILSYDYNDLVESDLNYVTVLAYKIGDPLDTEPKLWLFSLPTF